MSSPLPDAAFETAFFAIVEDLGLTKEELAQARDKVSFELHNVYREYLSVPEPLRLQVLDRYARVFTEHVRRANGSLPPEPDLNPQDIFPILRPRAYFVHTLFRGQIMNEGKPTNSSFFTLPFTENFSIGLVSDDGKRMNVLTDKDVESLKIDPEDLYEQALENLRQSQPLPLQHLAGTMYVSDQNEKGYSYDGSLLLLPECTDQLPLTGTITAFVTNSDRLLVTNLEDLHGDHPMLRTVIDSIAKLHHPISASPFILADGVWKEAVEIERSSFLALWRPVWVKERIEEMNDQREFLRQLQPELVLPEVYMIGLNLGGPEAFCVSATDAPKTLNEPFFLTDTMFIPFQNGEKKTISLRLLMLELPGVIQTDNRYQPRLAHFTRNLTAEEVTMLEQKQKAFFKTMSAT